MIHGTKSEAGRCALSATPWRPMTTVEASPVRPPLLRRRRILRVRTEPPLRIAPNGRRPPSHALLLQRPRSLGLETSQAGRAGVCM